MLWHTEDSVLFPGVHLLIFPVKTSHWRFIVLEIRKAVLEFLPCTSLHARYGEVVLQKDRFPQSGIAIWALQQIKRNWKFQACLTLLHCSTQAGFCWKDIYSCVQRCWVPLKRGMETLVPWRKNHGESTPQSREKAWRAVLCKQLSKSGEKHPIKFCWCISFL